MHLVEVRLLEPPRGERGGAHADAAGDEGGLVSGYRVLVERDVGALEHRLGEGHGRSTRGEEAEGRPSKGR